MPRRRDATAPPALARRRAVLCGGWPRSGDGRRGAPSRLIARTPDCRSAAGFGTGQAAWSGWSGRAVQRVLEDAQRQRLGDGDREQDRKHQVLQAGIRFSCSLNWSACWDYGYTMGDLTHLRSYYFGYYPRY